MIPLSPERLRSFLRRFEVARAGWRMRQYLKLADHFLELGNTKDAARSLNDVRRGARDVIERTPDPPHGLRPAPVIYGTPVPSLSEKILQLRNRLIPLVDHFTEAERKAIAADIDEAERVQWETEFLGWAVVIVCAFAAGSPGCAR